MKKTITICDKCGKEVDTGKEIAGFDLCESCFATAYVILDDWIGGTIKKTETEEEFEELTEIVEEVEEVEEAAPKSTYNRRQPEKKRIDWGKACALKKAGWKNSDIADELGINVGTVNAMIYKEMKKYDSNK